MKIQYEVTIEKPQVTLEAPESFLLRLDLELGALFAGGNLDGEEYKALYTLWHRLPVTDAEYEGFYKRAGGTHS